MGEKSACGRRITPRRPIAGKKDSHPGDPFPRGVYLQAPREWCPRTLSRIRRLNAPAYGLNDAPVEFHKTLERYLVKSEESLKLVGLP